MVSMPFGASRGQGFNNPVLQSFAAGNVRINRNGLFIYSGPPALGNLIVSIAFPAGTDAKGNTYPAGFSAGTINVVGINFAGGASISSALNRLLLQPGSLFSFTQITTGAFLSNGGSAANPSVITTDTWHTLGLLNGWTGTFQYMLMPDNTVKIRSVGSLGAGVIANGTSLGVMSGIYVPSLAPGNQTVPCVISSVGVGSAATGNSPYLQIDTAGNVTVVNIAVQVATNIRFRGDYSLS